MGFAGPLHHKNMASQHFQCDRGHLSRYSQGKCLENDHLIHRPPLLQDQWAAAMTLRTVLLSIQVLCSPLIIPECNLSLCRPCWPPRSLMTLRTLWWRGSTRKISQSLKRPLNIGPPRLRALLTKYASNNMYGDYGD